MKLTIIRLTVAALILASIGYLAYYFIIAPDAALSTYNQISNLAYSDEYLDFDENLTIMSNDYISGSSVNGYYKVVNNALNNNFNYYKGYLLFVSDVSQMDQTNINSKINEYEESFLETNRLLLYFNDNLGVDDDTKAGMHTNFIISYNETIKIYVELIEELKSYVIKYAFNDTLPVGLKQTLLQVQLDFAKVAITEKLDATANPDTLITELNAIVLKFSTFNNDPQGNDSNALNFIDAYNNFENLQEYF